MNESSITRVLLEKLRKNRDWVVIKHADRFTVGVPDTSVTTEYGTTWLEKKFLKNTDKSPTPIFRPSKYLTIDPQVMTMYKLSRFGWSYYLIFFNFRYGVIWQIIMKPGLMLRALQADISFPLGKGPDNLETTGVYMTDDHLDFTKLQSLLGGRNVV